MKTTLKNRLTACVLTVAVVLSACLTALPTALAAEPPAVSNISVSSDLGYYVKDGTLFRYDPAKGTSEAVEKMTGLDVDTLLYDGTTLYTAGSDNVVRAYNPADWSKKWEYDSKGQFQFTPPYSGPVTCRPNAEMVLKDGTLYLYTYAMGGTFIQQAKAAVIALDAATGKEKTPATLQSVYDSNGTAKSIAYELDGSLIFTGSTFASVALETGAVTYQAGLFDGAALYEKASSILVGMSSGSVQYAEYPLAASPSLTDMKLTPAGENPIAAMAGDVPVFFSIRDGKVVYDVFTGLDLVTRQTAVSADEILSLSVQGNTAYLITGDGSPAKITLDFDGVPTHKEQSAAAKELVNRIKAVLKQIPTFNGAPDLNRMSLETEKEINAIDKAYQAMSAEDKKGVFNAEWIGKLKEKTAELRANLDKLNETIAALPDADALKKTDAAAVKAAQNTYNGLKDFDKTLVSEKLFRLLEKTAAYDVIDLIDALPAEDKLTTADLTAVQTARKGYNAVVEQWKAEVTNLDKLQALEKKLETLMGTVEDNAYWSSMAKDHTNNTIVESKLPTSLEEMQILLNGQTQKLSVKEPIIVGERMYAVSGKQLVCYNLKGEKIAAADLYGSAGFFSRMSYGDGKLFVALSDRIQAFDANTLSPLWLSPSTGEQMLSALVYNDGYLYTGTTDGGGGGTAATDGRYFCLSTADEDTSDGFEVKDYVWESKTGGYYWADGVVVGDRVYFAGDSGVLYAHHLTRDIVYDTFDLGGQFRSNIIYDPAANRLIAATKSGTLFTIPLKEDGTFDKTGIRQTKEGAITGVAGGIAAYRGRIYVTSGGMHVPTGKFFVLDANTLSVIYETDKISSQSYPIVCTAYANEGNDYLVYLYLNDYQSGVAYILEDSQSQTAYKEAFRIGNDEMIGGERHQTTTYNSSSFKADQFGNLYFIGGSSWGFPAGGSATTYALTVFQNKNAAFTAKDVENAIALLPDAPAYTDKETVLQTKERYDAFVNAKQGTVSNEEKLLAAVEQIERLTAEKLAETEEAIAKIGTVTLEDEAQITLAVRLYSRLLEKDKRQVAGADKLKAAENALFELKASVEGLIEKIDQLPEKEDITLADQAAVQELWAAYEALSEDDQKKITNLQRLLDARDKIKELNDLLAVSDLIAQIGKLPEKDAVTLAEEETVTALYTRYDALHAAAKDAVTNRQKLLDAYEKVTAYRAAVDKIDALIWDQIDPLHITLKDETNVAAITALYDALRKEEQPFVTLYDDLKMAQEILSSLKEGIIPKQVFENIAGQDETYTYEGEHYTLSFDGQKITAPRDFRYGLSVDPIEAEELKKFVREGMTFAFVQAGAFPGAAAVTLQTELPDGEYQLYRYEPLTRNIQKAGTAAVKDGQAALTVTEGGIYAVAAGLKEDARPPKTDASDIPAAALIVGLVSLTALFLEMKKKRTR